MHNYNHATWEDRSNAAILAAILNELPNEEGKPDLITAIEIVWTMQLGEVRGSGVLIVYTARSLTCDGGDGWSGLDGNDMFAIEAAVRNAIHGDDGGGLIDRFIVREQQRKSIGAAALNPAPAMVGAVDDEQPWLPGFL